MGKKVLVIGSGGREHALVWKLAQSSKVGELFVAPGNGGTGRLAQNIPISATEIDKLASWAEKESIDLTVVGPDDPLALGIVDVFQSRGLKIFGPRKAEAQLEASKAWAKEFMQGAKIPTAEFRVFRNHDEARRYVQEHGAPIVIKASGLALGKGVYVCHTLAEAERALKEIMLDRVHKDAGSEVVVEEFLPGQEVSLQAFCDGKNYVLLPPAQDHKRALDNDQGKNTGGMGTISPLPWFSHELLLEAEQKIIQPTLTALKAQDKIFTGCLYPGLMATASGLKVVEYNVRLGDPEAQVIVRRLNSDLFEILEACVEGRLAEVTVDWHSDFAVCIVLASGGYPGAYQKGIPIYGMEESEKLPGVVVFHAGTSYTDQLRTSGGRVLGVTATGSTLRDALDSAYEAVSRISFEGMHYRRDIGVKAL